MRDQPPDEDLTVEIVFDPACPWCFIGKRRFEQALAARPHVQPRLRWRPFLLHPDMPEGGLPRRDYLARRYGGEARARRVLRAISDAGQSSQIHFAFDHIRRAPSSVDAHRLVRFADSVGLAHTAVEALFRGHFVDGRDIGDRRVLVDIGDEIGLEKTTLAIYLDSDADVLAIHEDHEGAALSGVSGVPTFIFNGGLVIAGAQEPRILAKMLDVARETVGFGVAAEVTSPAPPQRRPDRP